MPWFLQVCNQENLCYSIGKYLYEGELFVQDTNSVEPFESAEEIKSCECQKCPDIYDVSNCCRLLTK